MNITKESVDALNAIVKVDIVAEDYKDKVNQVLNDYRKKANIPGFRKGRVPMGMVKKQYGKSVMIDEVNKLLQESLNKFLIEEELYILGNPLPKMQENFSWDADAFTFEFELGLAPEFEITVNPEKKVTRYNIIAEESLIDKEVENLQIRYGKTLTVAEVSENSDVTGIFTSEEKELERRYTVSVKDINEETNLDKFVGAKVGDVLELNTKDLFIEEQKLFVVLGLTKDEMADGDFNLSFTIQEITETELADLDQDFFNESFPDRSITTVTALRDKIKQDTENRFQEHADQHLLNAVVENFIDNTKFDLPVEFLEKWIATAGEKELSEEEAKEEFSKSEKGLRYRLIQDKIIRDNGISIDFIELKEYSKEYMRELMAKYGHYPEDKELEDIVGRILTNPDEVKRLQDLLLNQKLLNYFKENMSFKTKELTFVNFVKEVYK